MTRGAEHVPDFEGAKTAPDAQDYPLGKLLAGPHLPALDGLRMLAVVTVIVGHVGYPVPADLGVNVFFVLSGFLITWLLLKERARTGRISFKTFYLRRAFRLLPAYYVFLALSLANYYGRSHGGAAQRTDIIVPSLLYYANYFNALHDHPPTPISHTWSLAVEEQFYVLWPLVFSFFYARGRRPMVWFLAVSIALVATWRSLLFCYVHVGTAYVYNAFDTRFDSLAVGCLAAVMTQSPRVLAVAEVVARCSVYPMFVALLIAVSRSLPLTYHYSLGFSVEAALIGVAMLQLVQLASRPTWRWLDHPAVAYLGKISYPMYLYHGICNSFSSQIFRDPSRLYLRLALALALTIVLGTISFYLVERPFLRLRQRFTHRPAQGPLARPGPVSAIASTSTGAAGHSSSQ
jgi:peptidoglycan/LPS O-acetylase OafA/YrhL